MTYLHRNQSIRRNPAELLPGAKSAIVVALLYHQSENQPAKPTDIGSTDDGVSGRVAMYAWGKDYHDVLRNKLRLLAALLRSEFGDDFDSRICVDTAPIIERELAESCGIGWIGKNTLVLNQQLGSYFFLGEVFTTLDMEPDSLTTDHCGSCTACLDACPTRAFPAPYEMDASRCISYLTIEHREEIDPNLQAKMGDWVFGCDVCQEVCPFNRKAPTTREAEFIGEADQSRISLAELTQWTADGYRHRLRDSAMRRASLPMLQRNAEIVRRNIENRSADHPRRA